MAGSDTFRGCSFQGAYCVGLALDVLEGAAETLVVEGDADVVDAALLAADGSATRVSQAKTKAEPHTWGPTAIAATVAAWLASGQSGAAWFDFVTDGSLGRDVVGTLKPALRRVADGVAGPDDEQYLARLGLDPADPALARVSVRSRMLAGRELLERATLRVVELRERGTPVSVEQARDIVWKLFGEVMLRSGEAEFAQRRIGRAHVAEIVGVDLAAVDDAEPWSEAVEAVYRAALVRRAPDPAWTLLDTVAAERPAALAFVRPSAQESEPSSRQPATALLDRDDGALLSGAAGAGKSTTLTQLADEALARGMLPLPLRLGTYVGGTLGQVVRRRVERLVGHALAPGAVGRMLDRDDAILLLDGAGELPGGQRQALIDDLRVLRDEHPRLRVLLAAREAAPFGSAGVAAFVLQGLDGAARREIAATLVPDGERLVEEIEQRLTDVVDNPLLFALALGLSARGQRPASRAEVFDGFMLGLQRREDGVVLSAAALAAIEGAAFDLRLDGLYGADRWWWLERLTATRAQLVARGTLPDDAPSAEALLDECVALGLVRTIDDDAADVALLHDLFCDWLASEAVRHELRTLPDALCASLEEAVVFLAERDALTPPQMLAVAGNAVAAARVADVLLAEELDAELADAIWHRLREQLAPQLRAALPGRLRVVADDPPWVCLEQEATDDPAALAAVSPVLCFASEPVSSLSVPVDLWLAVLRLRLAEDIREAPERLPRDRDDLARLVEAAVAARAATVDALLAETAAPSLRARIASAVGPSGLHGWLLPAEDLPAFPGGGEVVAEHVMHYATTDTGGRVELVASDEEIDAERTGTMVAESYLRASPRAAAVGEVNKALGALMPRYGD